MAKNTAQKWIFFLERSKVQIYHPSIKSILEVNLSNSAVNDLEIKKISEIEKSVNTLLVNYKIPTLDPVFLIIGNSAVISETLPNTTKQASKERVDEIARLAPFDHVSWTSIQTGKDLLLIFVNREFYEGFQEILESMGYSVASVTPLATLGTGQQAFSMQLAKEIIKRTPAVRQNSFIIDPEQVAEEEKNTSSDPRKNKKLLILLVVLIGMILVLGGVVVKTQFLDAKPRTPKAVPTPTQNPTPLPTILEKVEESTSSAVVPASASGELEKLKIQILNASGEKGLAESARQDLISSGFKAVETGNTNQINSAKIQIVFSPSVPSDIREAVISSLSAKYPDPATREEKITDFDAIVTLTKQN